MQVAPHSCPVYVYYDIETSEEEYLECINLERLLFLHIQYCFRSKITFL